ncbi:MAG: hypothetical protein EHM58_17815 [Ignavibacteriae bacterium]|nr:MAG: hypothetical protein EHM58_17815 [Ignavibacteriota bacterium]
MRKTKITFCWVFCGSSEYGTDESFYRDYLKKIYLDNPCSCLVIKNEIENINNKNTDKGN